MNRVAASLAVCAALVAATLEAGQGPVPVAAATPAPTGSEGLPFAITGPPPPEPPSVIRRDPSGRATVRAVRLASPLRIDGKLDEPIYETVPSMSDFIQQDPVEGAPATEKTEVWVFFDADNFYVTARCWESRPDRMVANEMQRDSRNVPQNESVGIAIDTFYDHRNSMVFEMTSLGGRYDGQVTNERNMNNSWNPVWRFATGKFDRGWVVEERIPFKSIRYRPGTTQIWGFNVRRRNQWKNETSYLVPIPASFGPGGHFRGISLAATLVGLEVPSGSKNVEIKPYGSSSLTTENVALPRVSNDVNADWGADVKYGITQNMTADMTYKTDFAQVEADEQQVNLTRFSLLFPEKRDFFLENQGTYEFGGVGRVMPNSMTPGTTTSADVPILFYSRRIGLDASGNAVPIVGGGRLTGRVGKFSLGLLNIESDKLAAARIAATNFSVARVKRDILRKSSVGVAFTRRSLSESAAGSNAAYGIDGTFGFFDSLAINAFWAQSRSPGQSSDDTSYRAQLDYTGDRYGVQVERLMVGSQFNPEVGYVRHRDMRRSFGQFRFSPRTRQNKTVRKLFWIGWADYIENGVGRVDTRQYGGEFDLDFHSGDRYILRYTDTYEFLPAALRLAPGATVPTGGYEYGNLATEFNFGRGRKLASGNVGVEYGTFYDGHKTTYSLSQGRVAFPPHLSIEPTYSINRVQLARSEFTTHLVGSRLNVNVTPLMFVGALLQYNSTAHNVSANVRLRWEYQPGSELFIVLNEQRDTLLGGFPYLNNRTFIIKINRLFRF